MATSLKTITNAIEDVKGYSIVLTREVHMGKIESVSAEIFHADERIVITDMFYGAGAETKCAARAHDLVAEDISRRASQPAAPAVELPATLTVTEDRATGGKRVIEVWLVENITAGTWRMASNAEIMSSGSKILKGTKAERQRLFMLHNQALTQYEEQIISAGWKLAWIGENGSVWFAPVARQSDPDDEIDMDLIEVAPQLPDSMDCAHCASQPGRLSYCDCGHVDPDDDDDDDDMGIDIIEIDYEPACHRCGASSMLIPHYGDSNTLICPECEATSSGMLETLVSAANESTAAIDKLAMGFHAAMQTNGGIAINGADLAWANCPYCQAEGVQMERDVSMPAESAWHVVKSCIHAAGWNVGKTMANPYLIMVKFIEPYQHARAVCGECFCPFGGPGPLCDCQPF